MSRLAVIVICLAVLAQAQAADYRFKGRTTAPANDINCGQKDSDGKPISFCRICDGVAAVADACDNNPKCQGFDMEGSYCGYLKAAAGKGKTSYTEGFSHYCKIFPKSNCEGDYIARRRSDVLGKDVDCNAKDYQGKRLSYCEVSGSLNDVAAACGTNPTCKAFTTTSSSGGYLKTAAGPATYTEGTVTYVKG